MKRLNHIFNSNLEFTSFEGLKERLFPKTPQSDFSEKVKTLSRELETSKNTINILCSALLSNGLLTRAEIEDALGNTHDGGQV